MPIVDCVNGITPLASPAVRSIDDLLEAMVALGASDLHLTVGTAPAMRIRGELERLDGMPVLTPDVTQQLLYRVLSTGQQKQLEITRQIDTSYAIPGLARFRVNVYFQREALAAAFRVIPEELKTLEELGLPSSLAELAMLPRGLVLVTGPTGSGKSTTLAAMIDEVNRNRTDHILTIEDPIEFVHRHKRCIVNQREIGVDATSFGEALRAALRQDPDVILVGEMRDLETIGTALTAAETGHLVLGTLHTQSAPGTVDRIIDVFPAEQQEQVRIMLAGSLQGIVTQALLPTCRRQRPRRRAGDPAARRRHQEPDPAGEGRADLHDHADLDRPRDDDDGAVAREPRPPARDHTGSGAAAARAAPTSSRDCSSAPATKSPSPALQNGLRVTGAWMSDGKNTPIWKKEISFRRKPEEAAPEQDAGSTPLWKKEVSFRKKSEAGTVETPAETPADAVSEAPVEDAGSAVDLDLIARYAGLPATPHADSGGRRHPRRPQRRRRASTTG